MANFINLIGDQDGPLNYTVTEITPTKWEVKRHSKDDDTDTYDEAANFFLSEDEAMQHLWDIKERVLLINARTEIKKDNENRESSALILEIGEWTPPPEV